jgi:hypothetical protein
LIDSLRYTNFTPYVKTNIDNQKDTLGRLFSLQIPDSTFIDDDGNHTLIYSATLSPGNPLPGWLSFDPATRTFSGIPTATGVSTIKVTATDTFGASAYSQFKITIVAGPLSVEEDNDQLPKDFALEQNYPNPFNPSTNITFNLPSKSFVSLKVFDLIGRDVATLALEELTAGTYTRQWNATNMPSGIYFCRFQARQTSGGQAVNTAATKKLVVIK